MYVVVVTVQIAFYRKNIKLSFQIYAHIDGGYRQAMHHLSYYLNRDIFF